MAQGLTRSGAEEIARRSGWFSRIPIVEDPLLHPSVIEICDPDTQRVLGGVVLGEGGVYRTVPPWILARLRRYPDCRLDEPAPQPWRVETPIYAEVAHTLKFEPLGVSVRTWLDLQTGILYLDDGESWVPVAEQR